MRPEHLGCLGSSQEFLGCTITKKVEEHWYSKHMWSKRCAMRFTFRPGATRAFQGRASPNYCLCFRKRELCPPKRGLCAGEINRLGATGEQFEAWDSQNTGCHPRIREQELFFCRFCYKYGLFLWFHPRFHGNSRIFWDEDFIYFLSSPQISSNFATNTFFLVYTLEFKEIKFSRHRKICLCPPPLVTLSRRWAYSG